MAPDLWHAIERLELNSSEQNLGFEDTNDDSLSQQRLRKRVKPGPEKLKKQLEDSFLNPPRWDIATDPGGIYELAPTQTRTIIRFTREGLEGKVTGYKEVTVPANSATAKNSTSLLRKPANRADFVRGAAGFFPFAPGGLDGVTAVAALEDQAFQDQQQAKGTNGSKLDRVIDFSSQRGLLEIPPGFTRGLDFEKTKAKVDRDTAKQVEDTLGAEPNDLSYLDTGEEPKINGNAEDGRESGNLDASDGEYEDVDSLLPVEFPALEPHGVLASSSNKRGGREWAHMVDVRREIPNFQELVPDMARTWPFKLDTFQKEAVYHLENGDSVFVAAHTSAGKTVVAEYAIALAAKHMTKAIYTSPIKALSNQKFRDFRLEFTDVGILTGDVQINAEASCLIMTTEILRSMLYRGADLIRDVEFVIFDEVHYVNDLERGVVWEEAAKRYSQLKQMSQPPTAVGQAREEGGAMLSVVVPSVVASNEEGNSSAEEVSHSEGKATLLGLDEAVAERPQPKTEMRLRELLSRGIAVHHGGLLPIVKEVVEILFAKTLVKVLFATETFAMGLNLPTRTVVFSGFRKHDGRAFRDLLPGEYTQMAGRAGRRGLDPVGSVIIVNSNSDEAPPAATLKQMILGDPTKLRSQFRLTYNMILNLLRVEALKIEEMIKRSFSENATQALLPEQEKQVKVSEADLAKIKREPCDICDIDLKECHSAAMAFQAATADLHRAGVLTREGVSRALAPTVELLSLGAKNPTRGPSDLLPYLAHFRPYFAPLPKEVAEMELKVLKIPLSDLNAVTGTIIGIDDLLKHREEAVKFAEEELVKICSSWSKSQWDELDWSRIKELTTRDILESRKQEASKVQQAHCLDCPKFVKHIHSADELVLTELILENVLADFEPEEIVALLSAFIFQEKTDNIPTLTPHLENGRDIIIGISEKVNALQTQHQVILSSDDSNDFTSQPRFGLIEVVYEWARGMSFNRITDLTDVLEGTIVRVITRLDETCREVKNAARIIGDPALYAKMQMAQEMIKRDITAVASLYM
ncbi:antiviral helicase SKI2, partial [Lecanoromycetidae sp. Uapishka_2]